MSLPELLKPSRLESVRMKVTGPIPPTLKSLSQLRTLNLADNDFFGSIPIQLGDLQNLRILNMSHNQLTQTIPTSFSNLVNLEVLALTNNMIAGPLPVRFRFEIITFSLLSTLFFSLSLYLSISDTKLHITGFSIEKLESFSS